MKKIFCHILLFAAKMILVIVIAVGLYHFGRYAYDFGHQLYDGRAMSDPPGKDVAVVVLEGESVESVAEKLKWQGLISDTRVFCVQERLSKYHGQMKPGNYVLNTSQNAEEILAVLSGNGTELTDSNGE